jgi:hypothetical protein
MKKLLYVLLAMTVAFAMVGCGGDDDTTVTPGVVPPPPPTTVDITFDLESGTTAADLAQVGGVAYTLPATQTIVIGAVLTDFPPDATYKDNTKYFQGWFDGDDRVTPFTTFSVNTTLIAKYDTNDPRITIDFTVDTTNGGDYTATTPTAVKIFPGFPLGDAFPDPVVFAGTGDFLFDGWFIGTTGNVRANADIPFSTAATLQARFKVGIRITFYKYIDPDYDPTQPIVVGTNDPVGSGVGDEVTSKVVEAGGTFEDAGLTLPAALPDSDAPGANLKYRRWELANGNAVTTTTPFDVATPVFGAWLNTTLTTDANAKAKVVLENGAHVIVSFDISDAGFDWNNYSGIEVDYRIAASELTKTIRAIRLYGTYVWSDTETQAEGLTWNGDFTKSTNNTTPPDVYYVAKFDSKNAAYIMNDKGGAWGTNWTGTLGIADALLQDKWFTVTYPIDGTAKNGNFVDANLPGGANNASATTVYFGIGLSGTNSNANANDWANNAVVQLIGDVKLKHKSAPASDIVGSLDFNGSGKLAFASQIDPIIFSAGTLTPADPVLFPAFVPPPYDGPVATTDFSVNFGGTYPVNLEANLNGENYQPVLYIPVQFPLTGGSDATERYTIASYANYTIKVKFYLNDAAVAADTSPVAETDSWGYGNFIFAGKKGDAATSLANFTTLNEQYNLGASSINKPIPPAALTGWETFEGFVLKNGEHNDVGPIIRVLEITFHAGS